MYRRLLTAACSSALLLAPAAYAQSTTETVPPRCEGTSGVARLLCMRTYRMQEVRRTTNVRQYIQDNSDAVLQQRYNRRSESQPDMSRRTISIQTQLRNQRMAELRERRQAALEERQQRYQDLRNRQAAQQSSRSMLLRQRINATGDARALEKDDLRNRAQRLHDRAQDRRNMIRQAHAACRDVGLGLRAQCLNEARQKYLNDE